MNSSKDKKIVKTLILSDIHNRSHIAEHIISSEKPDKIIFIGDYFDSYGDELNPDLTRETAKWFAWSINQPNRIHLAGNHDIAYWFPGNKYLWCPGFNHIKLLAVQEYVRSADWRKLQFYHNLDDKWLLSHAGVHPYWTRCCRPGEILRSDISKIEQFLQQESEKFLIAAGRNEHHWFVEWSRARSGTLHPGGLLWNDFSGDFHAILGVNQLVGHTHGKQPRWIYRDNNDYRQKWHEGVDLNVENLPSTSYNLCLDTGLQEYAIWNGTKLTIKSVANLIKKSLIRKIGP